MISINYVNKTIKKDQDHDTVLLIVTLIFTSSIFILSNSQEGVTTEDIPLIPRKVFFSPDHELVIKISPNGKYITFLKSYDGVLNMWLQNVRDKREAVTITQSKNPIFHYRWAQNNDQILFFQDFNGDENSHIYSVDLKTSKIIDLTPFDNVQARIIRGSENYPDEIVVAINNRDPSYHDLWLINTRTASL